MIDFSVSDKIHVLDRIETGNFKLHIPVLNGALRANQDIRAERDTPRRIVEATVSLDAIDLRPIEAEESCSIQIVRTPTGPIRVGQCFAELVLDQPVDGIAYRKNESGWRASALLLGNDDSELWVANPDGFNDFTRRIGTYIARIQQTGATRPVPAG